MKMRRHSLLFCCLLAYNAGQCSTKRTLPTLILKLVKPLVKVAEDLFPSPACCRSDGGQQIDQLRCVGTGWCHATLPFLSSICDANWQSLSSPDQYMLLTVFQGLTVDATTSRIHATDFWYTNYNFTVALNDIVEGSMHYKIYNEDIPDDCF